MVSGNIIMSSKVVEHFKVDISSMVINVLGEVTPQSKHNNKVMEAICQKVKPMTIIKIYDLELAKGKTMYALADAFSNENTKIPFRFKLEKGEHRYLETYIGVYINVAYSITVKVKFNDGMLKE